MVLLAFEGIRSSLRTALVLFTVEVAIVLLLALIIVGKGGEDGLSLHPLNPAASPNGFSGLTTGFVFAALSFVGFEAAATLGDEIARAAPDRPARRAAERARRRRPLRLLRLGRGHRPRRRDGQRARRLRDARGTTSPPPTRRWMKWPVIIASVSSMFAVMINSSNGIVRILNTMGREGLLPQAARLHRPEAALTPSLRDLRHRRVHRRHRARASAPSAAASAIPPAARTSTATSASC